MPTPVEWRSTFQANTGTASIETTKQPEITGLSNGNILVSWVEEGTGGVAPQAGNDIVGKIFDSEGFVVRDSFRLNTINFGSDEDDFEVAATNDGGFIIVYADHDSSNTDIIRWERKAANGNTVNVKDVVQDSNENGDVFNPQVVVDNVDNSSYVTWTIQTVGSFGEALSEDIRGTRLSSTGATLTSIFDAGENSFFNDENNNAAAININEELVSVYVDAGNQVQLDVYSLGGVLQHTTNVVASGLDDNADPKVATLTNGNIVVVWAEDFGGGDYEIRYRVYDSNLGAITGELTAASSSDVEDDPTIIALPTGGFVIAWDNGDDDVVEARAYTATGVADGGRISIPNSSPDNIELGVTGDGRLLFAWQNVGNIFFNIGDARGTTINTSDFDNPARNFVDGDIIHAGPTATTIIGDSGTADTIIGSDEGDSISGGGDNDSISGGGGNDTINGGGGQDTLDGGSGDDVFLITGFDAGDSIVGGTGTDTLDLDGVSPLTGVFINLDTGFFAGLGSSTTIQSIESIIGTGGADTITGESGSQTIDGGEGGDTLNGGGNVDSIIGGSGNDTIINNDGHSIDNINGGTGTDTLDLSDLSGSTDEVDIDLELGTWTGRGGTRNIISIESIIGTQGDDTIRGRLFFTNTIDGQGGDDSITGGGGVDFLSGGADNDTINGGSAEDDIDGGDGNDTIIQTGSDFIDNVDGGADTDTLDNSGLGAGFSGATIDFAAETITGSSLQTGAVTFSNIEIYRDNDQANTVVGSSASETIIGGGGNDTLSTGGGADSIEGGAGNDRITAGAGFETLDGGTGIDTLDTTTFNSNYTVNLTTGSTNFSGETFTNFENLITGNGNDTITGTTANNTITSNGGDDTIDGGAGADSLDGGAGTDTASYAGSGAQVFVDLSAGTASSGDAAGDQLGNIENLTGSDHDDKLTGDAGTNVIEGGLGDDTLLGFTGVDTLRGGAGEDVIELLSGYNAVGEVYDGGANDDEIAAHGGTFDLRDDTITSIENLRFGNDFFPPVNTTVQITDAQLAANFSAIGADAHTTEAMVLDISLTTQTSFDLSGLMIFNFTGPNDGIIIRGDADGETITGSALRDTVFAGDGDDVIIQGDDGVSNSIDGGAGTDTLDLSSSGAGFNVDGGGTATSGATSVSFSGIDSLIGTASADIISDFDEFDSGINSGAGDDLFNGGFVDSNIDGGTGTDTLDLSGDGSVAHTLNLDTGAYSDNFGSFTVVNFENVVGGNSVDTVNGNAAANNLNGGGGNDLLRGFDGDDVLTGGDGDDILTAGDDNDTLSGGNGIDRLNGQNGSDSLNGGAGNDIIFAGFGIDTVNGGSGDDTINGNGDADTILGSSGNDFLIGGGDNDNINGGGDDDRIFGQTGDDTLNGSIGNDILNGGNGNDLLIGGTGNDSLFGSNDDDDLRGGDGDDFLNGGNGSDTLNGEAGNDTLQGSNGGDTLLGGDGDDSLQAGDGIDRLEGGTGSDIIRGADGDDILIGGSGIDSLFGNDGDDRLNGGSDDDYLRGGTGNDSLFGGVGNDRFVFDNNWGADSITDFANNGIEKIDLVPVPGIASIADISITDVAGGAQVEFSGNTILVEGLTAADLDAGDFNF